MLSLSILALTLLASVVVGVWLRRREGAARETASRHATPGVFDHLGTERGRAAIVHFSADWCGPCSAVRRVVTQVVAETSGNGPLDIEVDIDQHAALAKQLGILSLPTTFVVDHDGEPRFRMSGVPTATELREALALAVV